MHAIGPHTTETASRGNTVHCDVIPTISQAGGGSQYSVMLRAYMVQSPCLLSARKGTGGFRVRLVIECCNYFTVHTPTQYIHQSACVCTNVIRRPGTW